MPLIINAALRTRTVPRPRETNATRKQTIDELLASMAWDPKERIGTFRSWLRGSLSLVHLQVITTLEADGPLSMTRLAEAMDVSVASATGIVNRMEERGLVERRHDNADRLAGRSGPGPGDLSHPGGSHGRPTRASPASPSCVPR